MVGAHDLIGFLSDENPLVRDHALRSLALASDHSGATAEQAMAVIDALHANAFAHPQWIVNLPPTEKAIARAMQWLAVPGHPQWVCDWIAAVPQPLLLSNPAWASEAQDGGVRARLAMRLELQKLSAEQLWGRLDAAELAPAGVHDLLRVLAQHDEYLMPRIMAVLSRGDSPLLPGVIELAGLTHLGSTVPALVDRLGVPDEKASPAAVEALARIGTAGAVTTIEQRCGRGSTAFRSAAADCLARFRVPSVEGALLRLLVEEDDAGVRGRICRALTDICATMGFDRLHAAVRDVAYTPRSGELEVAVAALSRMLKRAIPEADAWERQAKRAAQNFALPQKQERHDDSASVEWPGGSSLQFPSDADDQELAESAPLAAVSPIRRSEAKVGRNEPCPCGSGKKYKKCCGAQTQS